MTDHSMIGLSNTVNISFGTHFVAGKNLVPNPATVTGPGQAQGGLAGPALAPGPAPSKFTSL